MKQYLKSVVIGLASLLALIIILLFLPKQEINTEDAVSWEIDLEQVEEGSLEAIVLYLNNNYSLNNSEDLLATEVGDRKELSQADFAYYTSSLLKEIGIEAGVIRYESDDLVNLVLVFRNDDLPKYIAFSEEGLVVKHHGWSFQDLIKSEEERLDIIINRYLYFPFNTKDFREAISPFEWEYLN
jgi:hypothetical protein